MKRMRQSLFVSFLAAAAIHPEETTPPPTASGTAAEPAPAAKKRELEFALTAGLAGMLSNNELLKNNKGAEIGLIATLPVTLWREDANLIAVRGQYTSYVNGIETPSALDPATNVKLTNAGHSQVRVDFRQIFTYWNIDWSVGLGIQIPVTSSILTPRGEFSFADAKSYYPVAADSIRKIDRSYAGYLRFGVDQKILADTLIVGGALEINFAETPKTDQRAMFTFYAGARVW